MTRIKTLHLKNFKAFRDQEFTFDRQHALIYGNNGSGKSSIFWALYTFLQSSTKSDGAIKKYFEPLVEGNDATYQSLRNVFADPLVEPEAFVKVTFVDASGIEMARTISYNTINTNIPDSAHAAKNTVREAHLASDFLHYRFLQDFYSRSNQYDLNLWPVVERDLLPFITPTGGTDTLEATYRTVKAGAPRGPNNYLLGPRAPRRVVYQRLIDNFNQELDRLLVRLSTEATDFLKHRFFNGGDRIKVELGYGRKLDYEMAKTRQFDRLLVTLTLQVSSDGGTSWVAIHRPQSFLNEAQLTRVALAVRIAALTDRQAAADFKLLCIDDLLISLDMSNRRYVLDWLFDPLSRILEDYQVIFLTHDQELRRLLQHYIETRSGKWKFFELFMGEQHKLPQPYVPEAVSNDFIKQAEHNFHKMDFRTAGTYLRRYLEGVLPSIIPQSKALQQAKGGISQKELTGMVQALNPVADECGVKISAGPLRDLPIYVSLHLNPLAHDHPITAIYQDELWRFITEVVPALKELKRADIVSLDETKPTFVEMALSDATGGKHRYKLRLLAPLYRFTFPIFDVSGSLATTSAYSNPDCQLEEYILPSGTQQLLSGSDQDIVGIKTKFNALSGFLRIPNIPDLASVLTKI